MLNEVNQKSVCTGNDHNIINTTYTRIKINREAGLNISFMSKLSLIFRTGGCTKTQNLMFFSALL